MPKKPLLGLVAAGLLFLSFPGLIDRQRPGAPVASTPSKPDAAPIGLRQSLTARKHPPGAVPPASVGPISTPAWPSPPLAEPFSSFRDWWKRYQREGRDRPALLAEGQALAAERRLAMRQLIRRDPERALREAVSLDTHFKLPNPIKELVEEPFSARADFEVLLSQRGPTRGLGARPASAPPRFEETTRSIKLPEGARLTAFTYGRRLRLMSKQQTAIQGIRLEKDAAVWPEVFHRLTPAEAEVARQRYKCGQTDPDRCFATAVPLGGDSTIALAGGLYFLFKDEATLAALEQAVAKLDELPGSPAGSRVIFLGDMVRTAGPTAGAFPLPKAQQSALDASLDWTTTKKRMLYLRVDFPDLPGEPVSYDNLMVMLDRVSRFFWEMSRGKTWIEFEVSRQVLRLPSPSATYLPEPTLLYDDARRVASEVGMDPNEYDITGAYFAQIGLPFGGRADQLCQAGDESVIAHETGHDYGLGHAHAWQTTDGSVVGQGQNVEYGDFLDIMGVGASVPQGHFNPQEKRLLHWLDESEVVEVSASGTYSITRFDSPYSQGPQALRIRRGTNDWYWVCLRRNYPQYPTFYQGAYLIWERPGAPSDYFGDTWLLDTTPGSPNGTTDGGIAAGRTYADTNYSIYITPLAVGGNAPREFLDVHVQLDTVTGNHPPEASVQAKTNALVGESLVFSVEASDLEGDVLAYHWDFGDGTFSSNAAVVSHAWSQASTNEVILTVSDMKGGMALRSWPVTVSGTLSNQAVIEFVSRQVGARRQAGSVSLEVALSRPASHTVSVPYATRGGSAVAGVDYLPAAGTLTWAPGESGRRTLLVTLLDHGPAANDQTVLVELGQPSGAAVLGSQALVTLVITQPPLAPVIVQPPQSQSVAEGNTALLSVLTAPSGLPLVYQWYKDGVALAERARVIGVGSPLLSIAGANGTDTADYWVVVGNVHGKATSAVARLKVLLPPSIQALGAWPLAPRGPVAGVAVVGPFAYLASGSAGLQVIDLSDPANPRRVGDCQTSDYAAGVYATGNLAYVAESNAGLEVIDVSEPANPRRLGGYRASASGPAGNEPTPGVQVVGKYAYLAFGYAGLQVIDVSDPTNPTRVGGEDGLGYARGVQVLGDYAYVADRFMGLLVIDVRNPTNPRRVGRYSTNGSAADVAVVGHYAYVVEDYAGLEVIDISDPANPRGVGGFYLGGTAYAVEVVENHAYVAAGDAGLSVIETGDPTNPKRVGAYSTRAAAQGVQVVGNYAYVADGEGGLQVIDLSDPAKPSFVSGYGLTGNARGVQVVADHAYVADGLAGLQVIDVSDPAKPSRVGGWAPRDSAQAVQVAGNYAYVADGKAGLSVLEVRDLAHPTWVGSYDTSGSARGLQVVGQYAFAAVDAVGLEVIDVSDPAHPKGVGSYPSSPSRGATAGVQVVGNYAYVADDYGLQVIEVIDPTKPKRVGGYPLGMAQAVQVVGQYAFVAAGWQGLQVIDVSDPTNPKHVGGSGLNATFDYDVGVASGVQVVENRAYVADFGGLQVIDVSDPANPKHLGGYRTSGAAQGVQVVGDYAYVADGYAGLQILRLSFAEGRAPQILRQPESQTVSFGDVLFSIYAGGSEPLNFQWSKGSTTLRDGDRIQGVQTATLTIANVEPGDAGDYRVQVSNSSGSCLSATAVLRVPSVEPALKWVSSWPSDGFGSALSLEIKGKLAYVAAGYRGLEVIDVSDPANPKRLGGNDASRYSYGVQVVGHYAYVAAGYRGLQVIDVSDPANPKQVDGYQLSGALYNVFAYGVQVMGNYAYVAAGSAGLQVLDVSDPAFPTGLGGYETTGDAQGLQVVGIYAYVACGDGTLQVIDVRDPTFPRRVGGYDTGGNAQAVQVLAGYAYVACGEAGLLVLNVSDPANPRRVGSYGTSGNARGVHVVGNQAYLADGKMGLKVIDVTDPTNPRRVGGYATSGSASGVQVAGNYAYVAEENAGLEVIDVSDPAQPKRVIAHEAGSGISSFQVRGNYAYLADWNTGLQVIDVSDPAKPRRVGSYDTGEAAADLQVRGNYAYVLAWSGSLQVIDVSDPTQPTRLGGYAFSGHPQGIYVEGSYAYVVDWSAGLEVIDVSDPAQPKPVGDYASESAQAVQVVGTYAYLVDWNGSLQIIDVSDPTKPTGIGTRAISGHPQAIEVVGNYAYLACGDGGVQVIDVSDPTKPGRVGGYHTSGYASAVQVLGNYAYVAGGEAGLQMLDVSDPAKPRPVGGYGTRGYASDVQAQGNYAYVANGSGGLVVLQLAMPGQVVAPAIDRTRLRLSPQGFTLAFSTKSGGHYTIQVSEDLTSWREVGSLTAQSNEEAYLDATAPGAAHRFYRVKVLP